MTVQYTIPRHWIRYHPKAIVGELTEAKAAILSLAGTPLQRSRADDLRDLALKCEVAGTTRIESADFTEREFEDAISVDVPDDHFSRSQRQARAAFYAYRWMDDLPHERPIDEGLVKELHRRVVTGCDDDHCPPGQYRDDGHNVSFGHPRHRGAEGGAECRDAVRRLIVALNGEFRGHDPLVQALALHCHVGAMHPFHDGNGRTARALEALVLGRAHPKAAVFIAMSSYYDDEIDTYLATLSEARSRDHDLTPFIKFGLRGMDLQCRRLLQSNGRTPVPREPRLDRPSPKTMEASR